MNTAIVLAGGTGSRLNAEIPKQYIRIGGKMLITYALEPLLNSCFIDAVEIVADDRWRDRILEDARKAGFDIGKISGFTDPGENRQTSVFNGLQKIFFQNYVEYDLEKIDERDTVLIHDAARPFLKEKLIENCYRALRGHDGVMPVLPAKDTVYLSGNGICVEGLLERKKIYAGQAPEVFLLKKYYQANLALLPDKMMEINGSSEAAIMDGMDIVMIPGDEENFKITTQNDLQKFVDTVSRTPGRQNQADAGSQVGSHRRQEMRGREKA